MTGIAEVFENPSELWRLPSGVDLWSRMAAIGRDPVGYRRDGTPIWPILGGEDAPGNPVQPPAAPEASFPANTPLEQMTVDQREQYWKHHSRQHEARVKALGNLTPEQVAEMREKAKRADDLEAANATEVEKREKAARETAKQEADAQYRPMLVRAAFERHVGDRLDDAALTGILDDFNLSNFLKEDGTVDTAKVKARAEQIAPAKGTQQQTPVPKGPVVPGHNTGGAAPARPGDGARAYLEKKHGVKVA